MLTENEVRKKIRRKIRSGAIGPDKTVWGGAGSGMTCAACDQLIEVGGSEIEAQCVDGSTAYYHAACFLLVTSEREKPRNN